MSVYIQCLKIVMATSDAGDAVGVYLISQNLDN